MKKSEHLTEIPKQYNPTETEDKWYQYWEENNYFHSEPDDREPYVIVIPPPNVTGVLHMGHILNNTIQDILTRRARLLGKNACWVPGTDHASIATEAKVVQKLRKEGITKADLTREEFIEHAWEWTHKHGGIILEQLKKLGASCDWDRTAFTMDEKYSESVIDVFIDLYEKGKIYRGERMINWDPAAQTTLSNEEVIYREVDSKLYHVRYRVSDSDEFVTIATTRPETILGDTALCVHPDDERYTHLHGKKALVPLIKREIPIITDEYVDPEFGTGCLKITPAHDENDYEIGEKHDLETVDILNPDGTLSEEAQLYVGRDRFDVRKQIARDLEQADHLVAVEDYKNKVGFSERTDVPIEPRISLQWFVSMQELSKPALDHVMDDTIRFHPPKFKNSYRHWMENIHDWNISRQLWWGHRIPVYYYGEGYDEYVVAKTEEDAVAKARAKSGNEELATSDLKQDEDVLDTWFSSWLWPISVFNGLYEDDEIDYYYPTNDLVTAPEIMYLWVARMIIAGYEYRDEPPFSNVYYTGIVRDDKGRKMSKSLGNSPDPINLMEQYGADGVRVGMLFSSPAGNDLLFDVSQCEQGRNFANKIWNAFRFLAMNMQEEVDYRYDPESASHDLADRWMLSRIHSTLEAMNSDFDAFRINEALKKIYSLIWDDFCDWYIEVIKADEPGAPIPPQKLSLALHLFGQLMTILHPFMPFLTEEIWQRMEERDPEQALIVGHWPEVDTDLISETDETIFHQFQTLVSAIRNIRAEMGLSPNADLSVVINAPDAEAADKMASNKWILHKLQNIESLTIGTDQEKPEASASAVLSGLEVFVPLEGLIDFEKERQRIEKEIERTESFLNGVEKKLSNKGFVDNAPEEVVARERQKKQDAEEKLEKLKKNLADFS